MNAHVDAQVSAGRPKPGRAAKDRLDNGLPAVPNALLIAVFALLSLACLYPLLLVVAVSFTDEQAIVTGGYSIIPARFSLYAYRYLFEDAAQIFRSYGVSILVTLIGTVSSTLLTALLAFPLSRREMPYRGALAFGVFFTMLFSGGLVPWYLVYNAAGLNNTLWALVVPHLVAPLNVIVMRTFFANTIPQPLIESAKIDGAGEFRIFAGIVLPLSSPVLATVGLFQTLAYWNDWFTSSVFISDNKLVSLQYLMYKTIYNIQYLNSGLVDATVAGNATAAIPTETVRMAMAIVGIGPIVFVYPFLQKYFVKGLTVGAVKG
ncbi:carbohydrate ABC transporter permease [Paenibacillus sp. MWE-103]|uniref:Carbohydrate ABC transporter permease n=1 Tax=Paenibacillus artemisiicola TaxID=1172618 RepID=A0ABS3W965_9BACL|nr:carbohydrate ABC transporter permease [Paenibacillus artemisiicola]MBO7744864.1 carbohydrate ABC transporter permease [Paenibacillus artemisiicola]